MNSVICLPHSHRQSGGYYLRVLRVLGGEVDLILAEDTRRTAQLLHHFGISKPLESFHEHNERSKTEEVLKRLAEGGASIALVSDAGMPGGISDPGAWLIKQAIEANLPVKFYRVLTPRWWLTYKVGS